MIRSLPRTKLSYTRLPVPTLIQTEAGFFGVAPGTSEKSNPNALKTVQSNTIFTNVGVTADNQPWWEGLDNGQQPVTDWRGNRSEQHTSELQSLMRISYAVFCLKTKNTNSLTVFSFPENLFYY